MKKILLILIVGLMIAPSGLVQAQSTVSPDRQQLINQLLQQIRILQAQLQRLLVTRSQTTGSTPLPSTTPNLSPTSNLPPASAAPVTVDPQKQYLLDLFQKYIRYVRSRNQANINLLSWESCDPAYCTYDDESYRTMEEYISTLLPLEKLVDYVGDSNQAILSSVPQKKVTASEVTYTYGRILFMKSKGEWKVVKYGPTYFTEDNEGSQTELKLKAQMVDSDKDSIPNVQETCAESGDIGPKGSAGCVKTDPFKKDSDNDGTWDSFENFLKKN